MQRLLAASQSSYRLEAHLQEVCSKAWKIMSIIRTMEKPAHSRCQLESIAAKALQFRRIVHLNLRTGIFKNRKQLKQIAYLINRKTMKVFENSGRPSYELIEIKLLSRQITNHLHYQ